MKKLFILVLALCLPLALTACSGQSTTSTGVETDTPVVDTEAEATGNSSYTWEDFGISFDYPSKFKVVEASWGTFLAIGEGLTQYPFADTPENIMIGMQDQAATDAMINGIVVLKGLKSETTINGNLYEKYWYPSPVGDADLSIYYHKTDDGVFYIRVSDANALEGSVILNSLKF
ncbi:MAG: hypothetical protein AAB802_04090 [Patescibacteria group bacterium]